MKNSKPKVLLIYTGGTIGMVNDPRTGSLRPFNFKSLSAQIPELARFPVSLESVSFKKPLDSSDIQPSVWVEIAEIIQKKYTSYDGFVVLHGSDTMSYTASALSFMLENLAKPVILTGSQLPIGTIRTDGKENLITAIEIAAAHQNRKPVISEVCIYFEYKLYRGNRTLKYNSQHFDAFKSPNYPFLGEAGITIQYNHAAISKPGKGALKVHTRLENEVLVIHLFPGINEKITTAQIHTPGVKAIVLLTFGAGNASTQSWFIKGLQEVIKKGVIVLNVTQCSQGRVVQGMYQTSAKLKEIGVIGGNDITFESAIAKLMFLLGAQKSNAEIKKLLVRNLRGELSE